MKTKQKIPPEIKALLELKTRIEKLERTEETFATDWIDAERGNDVV